MTDVIVVLGYFIVFAAGIACGAVIGYFTAPKPQVNATEGTIRGAPNKPGKVRRPDLEKAYRYSSDEYRREMDAVLLKKR